MRVGADAAPIRRISDTLVQHLVPVPKEAAGTCPSCHTWLPITVEGTPPPAECENCVEVRAALDRTPLVVAVASLYCKPSPLRDTLTRYKGRDDEDDPFDAPQVELVRAMCGRLLLDHGDALAARFGEPDTLVVVPSTDRPPPHPLHAVLDSLELDVPTMPLLERGPGDMGFRRPHPQGFQAQPTDRAQRIWLVDDVYTTGSRLNSAAVALDDAGHNVVGAVVLARRINPGYSDVAADFWDKARGQTFVWRDGPWV